MQLNCLQNRSYQSLKHNLQIIKYTDDFFHVSVFSRPVFVEDGYSVIEQPSSLIVDNAQKRTYDTASPSFKSVNRAKYKILAIATQNDFKYMVTLTLDPDLIDVKDSDQVYKKVGKWLNNAVSRKNLKYLVVPEYHKSGAIHFHGLFNDCSLNFRHTALCKVKGIAGAVKRDKAFGHILGDIYNIESFPFGFSSAVVCDNNKIAISRYITKYCVKDLSKIFGSFYLSGGKGLIRSAPVFTSDVDFDYYKRFQWGRGVILDDGLGEIRYSDLNKEQLIKFLQAATEQNKCFIHPTGIF